MSRLQVKSLAWLVLAGLMWVSGARADDRVLLVEDTPGGARRLVSALRIQLTGAAQVAARPAPRARNTPERIRAATALVRVEDALLVVWAEGPIELPDGSSQAILYAVGQREGRALLEVVRVPGGRGPDMDRTLALKVRSMVDDLQRSRRESPSEAMLEP